MKFDHEMQRQSGSCCLVAEPAQRFSDSTDCGYTSSAVLAGSSVTVRRWHAAWQSEMSISRLAWRSALAASRRARGARCSSRSPFHANASAHARSHLEHDALAEARVGRAPARHPPGARGAACAHTACGGSTLVLSCKLTRARVLLRADDRASLAPRRPARNLVRKPLGGARQIARELRRRLLPFVLCVEYGHGSDIEEMRARFPRVKSPFQYFCTSFQYLRVRFSYDRVASSIVHKQFRRPV